MMRGHEKVVFATETVVILLKEKKILPVGKNNEQYCSFYYTFFSVHYRIL